MKKSQFFVLTLCVVLLNACQSATGEVSANAVPPPAVEEQDRLQVLSTQMLAYLPQLVVDSTLIPRTVENGELKGTPSKSWTSGFFPGLLWQLYDYSKEEKIRQAAETWQTFVEKEKWDSGTHDLGFKVHCSYGQAWRITKDEAYQDVIVTAANTLSTRFNPTVGAIRSWDHHEHLWDFPVIIDNMMNLEMLYEATRLTGDSSYYHLATQHAFTTLKNHFRPDNSSYHVLSYDTLTGAVVKKNTHQGYDHESAWSRGQAWGLYGYTVAYRYTQQPEFLAQAKKIAQFIFTHSNLPDDLIPYWDFDAPNIPNEPRDVSAATIAASGLFELSEYDPANASQYRQWANGVLTSLAQDKYQCGVAPFFLQHSVGSIPGKFEMDAPIIYADYYYVEALRRSRLQENG
ncbi:MAG: glucuronyl hydrolase [Bacteroidota bacterium]